MKYCTEQQALCYEEDGFLQVWWIVLQGCVSLVGCLAVKSSLLGLETLAAGTAAEVADHLVTTTKALATSSGAQVLLDQGVLGIDVAAEVVLALEVQVAASMQAGEREAVRVDGHVRLELRAGGEGLGAGGAGIRLCARGRSRAGRGADRGNR